MDRLIYQGVFGGLGRDRNIAAWRRNNNKVRATICGENLPVITATDGQEPRCPFIPEPIGVVAASGRL